jgi:hypothetical protein
MEYDRTKKNDMDASNLWKALIFQRKAPTYGGLKIMIAIIDYYVYQ